jgi:hypothetical protein
MPVHTLFLHWLDCSVAIEGNNATTMARLRENFGAMVSDAIGEAHLVYRIESRSGGAARLVRPDSEFAVDPRDLGELIYLLEADLVIQLQLLHPSLLFLHAAALEFEGGVHILTGHSGAGKSTTAWGLLHHGFEYLSDELAPLLLPDARVYPYPHALCMKTDPPAPYPVGSRGWRTPRGIHIPMPHTPTAPREPVRSILFIEHDPKRVEPVLTALTAGEAAARLYPNVLNALAHDGDGLTPVTDLTSRIPALRVESGELRATCEVICDAVRGLVA